jgi:hypothetical protein
MDLGDGYEILLDEKAPKGRRIVKRQAIEAEVTGEPTDAELRDAIEAITGERPHHRTGRSKLVEMLKEAQGNVS